MYDDLVKRLRAAAIMSEALSIFLPHSEGNATAKLYKEAADAIEKLSSEAEEYKAAYRKEHNKRIAESRYLYDELTKAVRAKLLLTPMRIEVPEPPKEE